MPAADQNKIGGDRNLGLHGAPAEWMGRFVLPRTVSKVHATERLKIGVT